MYKYASVVGNFSMVRVVLTPSQIRVLEKKSVWCPVGETFNDCAILVAYGMMKEIEEKDRCYRTFVITKAGQEYLDRSQGDIEWNRLLTY